MFTATIGGLSAFIMALGQHRIVLMAGFGADRTELSCLVGGTLDADTAMVLMVLGGLRRWGIFEVLLDESYCKVKRITVWPGQRLYGSRSKKAVLLILLTAKMWKGHQYGLRS